MTTSKNVLKVLGLIITGLIVSAYLLTHCARVNVKKEIQQLSGSVPLVGPYSSLMPREQVRDILGISSSALEKILEPAMGLSPRENQSQITRHWFEVDRDNALLGYSGKVRFEFYEDRLARIVFFPKDVGVFLMGTLKMPIPPHQDGVVPTTVPHLRIAFGTSHVVWMDMRVMEIEERAD